MSSFGIRQETGRPITIKDEGVALTDNVESIDFTGGGIDGSAIGDDVTEDTPAPFTEAAANALYLKILSNLADLDDAAEARTNLGLVAGGTGDIWVEKAGDTMTGQLVFNGVATAITTITNQDLVFKPHGSGALELLSGSGGVTIATESGNSDILITPHGTGSVFLNDTLEVESDGSGPGASSLGILKWINGDRLYCQTTPDRMFYTSDRVEFLSKDGVESIMSFNSSQSANPNSIIFYKGLASGLYAATVPPTGGAIISGDVGLGTPSPATKLHVKFTANTDWTIEGNNNFCSNVWKKANGTIMGYIGYSNTSGYVTGSINGGMHMRATNGWTFGHGGTLLLTMDNTDGLKMGSKRVQEKQGAAVASANDMTLGTDGNVFSITGTTQINGIATANWQAGSQVTLIFASTPTVKHNTAAGAGFASILIDGNADFSAAANTVLELVYNGTNWIDKRKKT